MTKASEQRIKRFVDWFIRSEYVSNWSEEKDKDYLHEPERAARVEEFARDGCDGRTHAEVIEDWREAFESWVRDKRLWHEPERFVVAVEAHFDAVEQWHLKNGTLWKVIG